MAQRIGDETIREFAPSAGKDPLIGALVDSYRIESIIGTGAMGIVYRARHTVIGKIVAIKVLKPDFVDDPTMSNRLETEARTVNAIHHPGIINTFGFGTLARTEQPYIVMDLLVGEPLDKFISQNAPVSAKVAARILDELLSALAAAHRVGVIHRDLKPGNCFLEAQPDGEKRLKLLDFGLARQADRAGGSIRPTNPGTLIGTPAFMAPEQVMGEKVTPATDLYAVGGMAYQLLTGHLPHEAPTAIDVLTQKMKFDPIRPRQWIRDLDEELDAWVMALLERDPDKRERDAEVLRRQLRRITERRTVAVEPVAPPAGVPIGKQKTGVTPKRDWGEARTILVEGVQPPAPPQPNPPAAATDSLASPWATQPDDDDLGNDSTLLSASRGVALGAPLPPSRGNLKPIQLSNPVAGSEISTVPPGAPPPPGRQHQPLPATLVGPVPEPHLTPPMLTPPSPTAPGGTPALYTPPLAAAAPPNDEDVQLPPTQRGLVAILILVVIVLIAGIGWLAHLLATQP